MTKATKSTAAAIDWSTDAMLTRREAAEMLRVSQSLLSRWSRTGEGPPVIWIAPKACRYLRSDIEAYIERNRSTGR